MPSTTAEPLPTERRRTVHPATVRPQHRRNALIAVALLILLVAALLASLAVGARPIPIPVVLDALRAPDPTLPDHAVIWDGRLPRTLTGLLAGAGLGVAGALMQAVTRNPLADPGLLGVNAGAAFAIVLGVGFLGSTSTLTNIWFALAGAILASIGVYLVGGGGRGAADPARLTLAGVALGAVLLGLGQGLALLDPRAYDQLRAWQLGTLDVRSMEPVLVAAPFIFIGLLVALGLTRGLNAIALGDDLARAVGARLGRTRVLAVLAVTLLAGASTAVAGAIAFVGLIVPHAVRRIAGPDQRWVVGLSVLAAPTLLLVADVVGRRLTAGEVPVGVVTAFIGGPVLVAVARARRVRTL